MSLRFRSRAAIALTLLLLPGARAHAVTIFDLNPNLPAPTLPTVVDGANSPVYITNTYTDSSGGEGGGGEEETTTLADGDETDTTKRGEVDTLRIGAHSRLHFGYSPSAVASAAVNVGVRGDMDVEGFAGLGKTATHYENGLPNAANNQIVELDIGGVLRVRNGGNMYLRGVTDGTGEGEDGPKHTVLSAKQVVLDGGSLTLDEYSTLRAWGTPPENYSTELLGDWHSVSIKNGGSLILNGGMPYKIGNAAESEGGEPTTRIDADILDDDAETYADGEAEETGEPEETETIDVPAQTVSRANRPLLNSNDSAWVFKGLDVSGRTEDPVDPETPDPESPEEPEAASAAVRSTNTTGSNRGILVDSGGTLAAGGAGGVIRGAADQIIDVRKGGILDAGRGGIVVSGMGGVTVAGSYRAGYDEKTGDTTGLNAVDGAVTFAKGSTLSLSRDLSRFVNRGGSATGANDPVVNTIVRGASVWFDDGVPTLETGMGTYDLELVKGSEDTGDYLRIGSVSGGVLGNDSDSDREQFRDNMSRIWAPGVMNRDMADNIYNLTALATPTVTASGEAGELNKAVLEAMTDGKNQTVVGHGVVDRGVFELYNGAAQWGVNAVALGTADEFMAQLDRRTERIGAEMDRLGDGWFGGDAFASCPSPEVYMGRIWAGGFGREDKADFDDGGSGYRYRPRGVIVGYDREVGRFNLGGALAYGSGNYRDLAATENDSKIRSYSAGLYGAYHSAGGMFVSGQATYNHLENDLADLRGGMRRTADYSSYAWTLGAKIGYDIPLSDRITLTPTAGLNYARAANRSHDEYLDDVGVMRVGELKRDSFTTPLEVTLGIDVLRSPESILRLTGTVGYAYDFKDGGLDGSFDYYGLNGATPMDAGTRKAGRNRFNAGAGLIFTGSRLDLTARYDYFQRRDQKTHQARGSVGLKF